MQPFYFGKSDKPLFGIYHPPERALPFSCGVVICHPVFREHVLTHRSLRELAYRLARAGFDVLRFDLHACGDSFGESHEAEVDQWRDDVNMAIDELHGRVDVQTTVLAGLRLGASLCATVGATRDDIGATVLWHPIVRGQDYVEELISHHNVWLRDQTSAAARRDGPHIAEVSGYPLTPALRDQLQKIDLLKLGRRPAPQALVLDNSVRSSGQELRDALTALEAHVEYRYLEAPQVWHAHAVNQALVPVTTLTAIESWLLEIVR